MESLLLGSEANSQLFFETQQFGQSWHSSRVDDSSICPRRFKMPSSIKSRITLREKKTQQHNIDISHKQLFTADNFIVIHASPAITEAVESCEMYSECVARGSLICQRNAAVFERDHSPGTDLIDSRILAVLCELTSGHGKPSITSIRVNERSSYPPNCK